MTAQTGRTVGHYTNFIIGDSANTLRNIPVTTVGGVGLKYEEKDLTALMDALKGVLLGQADFSVDIEGPFDTTAAAASPGLSGSHTVLSALVGLNTPRTLDIQIGVMHAWEAGEPQFGISRSATVGVIVSSYDVNIADMKYKATIKMFAGSTAPAWGTAAET